MNARSVRTSPSGGRQSSRWGQSRSHRVTAPAASTTGTYVLRTSDAPCAWNQANSANTPTITDGYGSQGSIVNRA